MNRRQLAFIILFNAIISLVIALVVVWAVEARRPDPEELAITDSPAVISVTTAPVVAIATATPDAGAPAAPTVVTEAPVTATRDFGETETYIVQTGDSLSSIADRFGVPIADLVELNGLPNPDFVFVGQSLQIPNGEGGGAGNAAPTAETNPESPAPITTGVLISALEAPGNLPAETVQITNDSNLVINLNGWTLAQENGPTYTFDNVSLFPGNYIWLHTTAGEDTTIARYWNRDAAAWTSGAVLRLRNPEGTEVATFTVP